MLKMIARDSKFFWFMFFPLTVLIIAGLVCGVLAMLGVPHMVGLAQIVCQGGTLVVLAVAGTYIVAFDSRKRWPGVPWLVRLGRVLTFSNK